MNSLSPKIIAKAKNLSQLKEIAKISMLAQFTVSSIYLFCLLLFPRSRSVAVSCGIFAILISLIPFFYSVAKKNFTLIFSCIAAVNLAPIWFLYLEAILPGYDAFEYISPAYIVEALFWISMFQLFINLFYVLFWRSIILFSVRSFSFLDSIRITQNFYVGLTFFAFFFPLIAFYLYYHSFNILWAAISAGREGGGASGGLLIQQPVGDVTSFMLPINWIWKLTPLFAAIAYTSSKSKYSLISVLVITMGLLVVFAFFLSGSRGNMMSVASPLFFFLFYYNWNRGIKFWIVAFSILFGLIGVMELQVRFRGGLLKVLANPEKAAKARGLVSATSFDPTETQRDNNLYLFCLIVKGFPARYPYEGFNDFIATLANPIPRSIWPGKPVLLGAQDVSHQSGFVLDGPLVIGTTSLSYSVVGEAYKANGLSGIVVYALVYSFLLIFLDGIIYYADQKRALSVGVLGIVFFLAFWAFRSFFALVAFSYPIVLLILILILIQKFQVNENYLYRT